MNKARRKELEKLNEALYDLQSQLYYIGQEEQEAYDNLPEGIQESERGEAMSDCAYEIDDIASDLEAVYDRICELIDNY